MTGSGGVYTLGATANQGISQNAGLLGSVFIKVAAGTNVTLSNATSTGLALAQGPIPAADLGQAGNFDYYFYAGSTVINPSTFFPLNVTVNLATFTLSPVGNIELVVSDLFPPVLNGDQYLYYSTALQVCNASQFEDNLVAPGGNIVILPIRLQSFTAKKFAANTSLLEWTTASEENASHIEIERSMDANSWSYVATEKARGSLNYNTDYSFVDAEAVLQRDRFTTVYYRLKLVDNDGSSEYSEVRSVTFDNNGIVSLEAYPNPSTEVINLRMAVGETNTNTAQMMMLDMTGKLVKKQTVSANGISVLEVDQLETGVYNIIVKHEDKTYQKRVIKTN